jgi:hypothetical protein
MRWIAGIVMAALIYTGCSTDRTDEEFFAPQDVGTLVVDGILVVGQPFPQIILSRAQSPGDPLDLDVIGEPQAQLSIFAKPDDDEIRYSIPARGGIYTPLNPALRVEPSTIYELRITTQDDERLTATTTTPAAFSIDRWVLLDDQGEAVQRTLRSFEEMGDSVYFADENQLVYTEGLLEARFIRAAGAPGYHVGIFSLDLDSDFVIDPAFFEADDFEDLDRTISSPAFEVPEGNLRLPWFAIFFQGRYKIKVFAVDENWYQLILTLPEFQGGFGGNIGEAFGRPSFNIDGGIGLFGSASADSIGFFILPRP